jgi:hypothetical protein
MSKGTRVKIRIDDAGKRLEKERNNPRAHLAAGAMSANNLYLPAVVTTEDAAGRDYEVLAPFDTDVTISVSSSYFALADDKGKALDRQQGGSEKTRIAKGQAGKVHRFSIVGVNGN